MKGTALQKAVASLDAAFARLPAANKRGVALALYRVWPAIRQYEADLEGLFSAEMVEATWNVLMAGAFSLIRGRAAFQSKFGEAIVTHAPHLQAFIGAVAKAVSTPPALMRLQESEHGQVDPAKLSEPAP